MANYLVRVAEALLLIFPGLLVGVVFHEFAHGYAAHLNGDPTPKQEGRLTLNPARHLDLFWSIVLPLILILFGSRLIFGMAKPVPINPYRFRNYRRGLRVVGLAGPLANILVAFVFGNALGLAAHFLAARFPGLLSIYVVRAIEYAVRINIVLAIFNLIPIPPLDGSRVVGSFLPWQLMRRYMLIERYGVVILVLFIYLFSSFFWGALSPVVNFLFKASYAWQFLV